MGKLDYLNIPLMFPNGLVFLKITACSFGDPYCCTIEIPKECKDRLHLPRNLFSDDLQKEMQELSLAQTSAV